jgi:phosphoesterase RecJ-like protein
MKEVDIALIFIEQTNRTVKISWRAQNGFDVSQVAEYFGGGGHRAASGAEIKGLIHEVQDGVLIITRDLLKNKEGIEVNNDE